MQMLKVYKMHTTIQKLLFSFFVFLKFVFIQ